MNLRILRTNLLACTYFYGFWNIANDLFFNTLYVTLFSLVVLTGLVVFLRLPVPSKQIVDGIIGRDPLLDYGESDQIFMKVVAHRGSGLDAPENSLIAFQLCAEKGCTGVEFDVTLTKDGVPIIFHDDTLERLTGSPTEVKKITWSELSQVDISVKHPLKDKFHNTHIATLEETVAQCLKNKQIMFIDIKDNDRKMVKVILDIFKAHPGLEEKAVCSSFYPDVIYQIRRKNPKIVCSLAYRPHFFAYESYSNVTGVGLPRTRNFLKQFVLKWVDVIYSWTFANIIYYVVGISILLLHKDAVSGEIVNNWREKGLRVIAWTVNHPVEKQHFSRILKLTYMTDTLIGESTAHTNNNARKNVPL